MFLICVIFINVQLSACLSVSFNKWSLRGFMLDDEFLLGSTWILFRILLWMMHHWQGSVTGKKEWVSGSISSGASQATAEVHTCRHLHHSLQYSLVNGLQQEAQDLGRRDCFFCVCSASDSVSCVSARGAGAGGGVWLIPLGDTQDSEDEDAGGDEGELWFSGWVAESQTEKRLIWAAWWASVT